MTKITTQIPVGSKHEDFAISSDGLGSRH